MTESTRAEEHLRVIRGLMERATIYRAISAPTALVGGLLSAVLAAILFALHGQSRVSPTGFLIAWIGVLLMTIGANTIFLVVGAKKRGEPFVSSGMKLAFYAILPAILAAAVFTAVLIKEEGHAYLPIPWMVFYGLALLATANFAPRSIVVLGWSFLMTGLLVLAATVFSDRNYAFAGVSFGAAMMGATFGLFHLIYAACTWPRKGQ